MRKTILITLLIFNVLNTFSQVQEEMIDKMIELANNNKGEEAKIIALDLLNLKYGAITNESNFFAQYSISDYYYGKRKYKIGLQYFNNLLQFTEKNELTIEDKKQLLKDIKSKIKDLKDFLPEDSTSDESVLAEIKRNSNADMNLNQTSNSNKTSESNSLNGNLASQNSTIEADKKETNTDKTVTLTVSGTGKTLEDAKLNALRSAIEQAFGAFISSKTEILNDNLVKDEIVSIANGNVQKYDVVSQVELPNAGYAITLSATVSIDRLTSFAESKGVVVEFKGGMFGATIKLQKLNEESEFVAIKNLLVQTLTILESAYDYSLKVNDPKLIKGDEYSILFEVSANKNDNYDNAWNFFKKTVKQISLNEDDALAIENTGKKVLYLNVDNVIYKLRNTKSLNAFFNFSVLSSLIAANSFNLKNNLETVKIEFQKATLFVSQTGGYYPPSKKYSMNDYKGKNDQFIISKPEEIIFDEAGKEYSFLDYTKTNKFDLSNLLNLYFFIYGDIPISHGEYYNLVSIMTPFSFNILQFYRNYKLSDLEKINSFVLENRPFVELMKNYEYYRFLKEKESYGCFLKGTKISISNGYKSIEDIKVGDEVTCFDDKGNLHTSTVESINKHENQEVYKYNVWNGSALYATPNHWVLTSENSFSEIRKLNEMLTLIDANGGLKPITKVEYIGKEAVYNFIVKDYHTYIANDIRVHNGGKGKYHMNISKK